MNVLAIKVNKTKAPEMKHSRQKGSKYTELFANMKAGHWFTINSKDRMKIQAAASTHLKGRYSLYQHPTMDCKYVFRLNK